jgi:hypothetical protein
MTMQSSDNKGSGFYGSVAGQLTLTGIVLVVILLVAWRYVF